MSAIQTHIDVSSNKYTHKPMCVVLPVRLYEIYMYTSHKQKHI